MENAIHAARQRVAILDHKHKHVVVLTSEQLAKQKAYESQQQVQRLMMKFILIQTLILTLICL